MDFLRQQTFLGNSFYDWLMTLAVIIGCLVLMKVFKLVILKRIKKWSLATKTSWDDFIISMIENSVMPLLYVSAFYVAISMLSFSGKVEKIMHAAYMIAVTFYILTMISAAFKKFLHSFIHREEDSETKEKQAAGLIVVANIFLWIIGIIFLIDNLGYNVTTLIAGLGVGGIAIALAAQTVLGDLFSYFVIFFDRPFGIGDFIVVGDKNGVIEYIGIKTTRIRTLSGEQLICSNTDLTNSRLHNYKRMDKRRVLFNLSVIYQITYDQLSIIPQVVKDIITSKDNVQYDRGHFSGYGDSSLNFEFVYYVLNPDYNIYMDIQQAIYLEIFQQFESRNIEFAHPTRTVFLNKGSQVSTEDSLAGISQ
ncbi:MAG: mechanosensitive ion channel family protein [Sphingobacteriales bacterium]|nr:MAG: mechanosensitive ion channel family protein [Sphingobacteriales bacterium]